MNKINIKAFLIILFSLIIHIAFVGLQPVNFEFSFSEAIKYIDNYDVNVLKAYFKNNANPLGFSLLGMIFYKIFPFNPLIILKIISLSGLIFYSLATIRLSSLLNKNISQSYLLLLMLFNPLIWNYSFRATPDFFAASLGFFSVVFLIYSPKFYSKIIFSIILGLSIIIKFHSLIFVFIYLIYKFYELYFDKKKLNLIEILFILFIIIVPVLSYFFLIFYLLDIFIIDSVFKGYHLSDINHLELMDSNIKESSKVSLSLLYFPQNFIKYMGFFCIFNFFIIGYFLNKNLLKIKYFFYFIFLCGLFFFYIEFYDQEYGEMDFGYLSYFVPNYFENKILILFSTISVFIISLLIFRKNNFLYKKNILIISFFLTILIYLILISFVRPVQRYLIFIIPLSTICFLYYKKINSLFIITSILIFIITSFALTLNNLNNSIAISKVYNYLNKNNILLNTHPGSLNPHIRHKFIIKNNLTYYQLLYDKNLKYIVSSSSSNESIICFNSNIFIERKYCVDKFKALIE